MSSIKVTFMVNWLKCTSS